MRAVMAIAVLTCLAGVEMPAHAQFADDNVVSDAAHNTGVGTDALHTIDAYLGQGQGLNTAIGPQALYNNTTGCCNTAVGVAALFSNTGGFSNNAIGLSALTHNTTGFSNTADGVNVLQTNTTGSYNTGMGQFALANSVTGMNDSSYGYQSEYSNTTGGNNVAMGYQALYSNKVGGSNTALGVGALYTNKGGTNTAVGRQALHGNTTGAGNIGIGYQAGLNITTGSTNIDIGSQGESADDNSIRLGSGQSKIFLAGVVGSSVKSGGAVVISPDGQLGVASSSERYKTAIAPMGSSTEKLKQLRPVTFRFKAEGDRALQYGLIAEDVAKVYPDLVIRNKNGRIEGVRYDELAPMLLNLAQQQAAEIRELKEQQLRMQTTLSNLQSVNRLVVQR